MISLTKEEEPPILVANAERWKQDYLDALAAGAVTPAQRYRYRQDEIKQAIRHETSDKCAYCESKVQHSQPGETDHILPVSRCPELIVAWDNLTYVCKECNRLKGAYYDPAEPIVNPYETDPEDHLIFSGPLVLHRDAMGRRTVRLLKFSKRVGLIERKIEKLERLNVLVEQLQDMPAGSTRRFVEDEILAEAGSDSEYAATGRAYLRYVLEWEFDSQGRRVVPPE